MKRRAVWGMVILAVCAMAFVGCAQQRVSKKQLPSIHFDFDKYNIKSDWVQTTKSNAAWMQAHPRGKLLIAGNCDERGTNEYNIGLGDRRARSAKSYLVNLGVSAGRISTISYGEERPVCTKHNESCWWKNRRDDFFVK